MKKRIFFLVMISFLILFSSLISAGFGCDDGESVGTFKKNTWIDLTQTCSNCSYNNITSFQYPNGTKIILSPEQNMTQTASTDYLFHTYNHTSVLGNYKFFGYGDENGIKTAWDCSYSITRTGYKQSTGESIAAFAYIILMLFITGILIYGGFKLSETDELWILSIFFFFLVFVFLIYIVWLAYEYQLKYVGAAASTGMPEVLFYMLLFLICAGFMVAAVLLFKKIPKVVKHFKLKKESGQDSWDNDTY